MCAAFFENSPPPEQRGWAEFDGQKHLGLLLTRMRFLRAFERKTPAKNGQGIRRVVARDGIDHGKARPKAEWPANRSS
jgi:hypothetical protein